MVICKDMKYTALYWALRFVENDLDVHTKGYHGYKISIYAERQGVDFGPSIRCNGIYPLTSHHSFVVLECVDRLLENGYQPDQISVLDNYKVCLNLKDHNVTFSCVAWDDYEQAGGCMASNYEMVYTSRLVSGLLEFKGHMNDGYDIIRFGIGSQKTSGFSHVSKDFVIVGDELERYVGTEDVVVVPEGIVTLGPSAFWNNTHVKMVLLPSTLQRLGGDCFYYCTNLEKVVIPENVSVMGNNPFAGCPKLTIENKSSCFVLEDGVLYNEDRTTIIHYTISKPDEVFIIPNTVTCIGKHCFFACDQLHKITIPSSVIKMENNPFSGCTRLTVENNSPYYHIEQGVIYNKYKTTVVGCLNGTQAETILLPREVVAINRNSFWNCKGIQRLIISENVCRIGYNPFAGSKNMFLESMSPLFPCENGIVFSQDKRSLLCTTSRAIGCRYRIPDHVRHIQRGAFSGCEKLKEIEFNQVESIQKSAFTNCTSLQTVYIPDSVKYIGEWAFAYCTDLKKISISKQTVVDKNAFNECPVTIQWRD